MIDGNDEEGHSSFLAIESVQCSCLGQPRYEVTMRYIDTQITEC